MKSYDGVSFSTNKSHFFKSLEGTIATLFLTEMTPVISSSSEMMKPRPSEDAKYVKLLFLGFPRTKQ